MMNTLHQPEDIVADRYRLAIPLGRGAFSTTYEAEDLTNYQRVALKVLSLQEINDWKVLELFEREARVLANLSHPGIPKYLDYFHIDTAEDRRFYIVQELIDGSSLAQLIEKGWHPDEGPVKKIALQVLEILNYLHQLQPPVIHRDIKPENIIRRADGSVCLVDFGAVQDVYRNTLTQGGTFVGTLGYMPQEQLRGQVGATSDLYSLGATLLFLLTRRSPDLLPQRRLKIDFRSSVKVSPSFADWLEKILEPVVEDRFQSASEAIAFLKGDRILSPVHSAPILARPPQNLPRRTKPANSRILLHQTPERLIVEILPNLRFNLVSGIILVLLLLGAQAWLFYLGSTFSVLMSANIVELIRYFLGFLINPFSLLILIFVVSNYGFQATINVDYDQFLINWKLWNFIYEKKTINTKDIELFEVELVISNKGKNKNYYVVIWEGVQKYRFGSFLHQREIEWLVPELAAFVDQLYL